MTPLTTPAHQPPKTHRHPGLDLARALAIFGMTYIHVIVVLSLDQISQSSISQTFDWFSGRPATLFMLLAGVGVSLRATRHLTPEGGAPNHILTSLWRRGFFFLSLGFLNLILWSGDILRVYGIAYLLALPLLRVGNRGLWFLVAAIPLLFLCLNFFLNFERNWNFSTLEYANLWTLEGSMLNLFFNGFRAVLPWVAVFFLGMIIGRLDLSKSALCLRWLTAAALIALAAEWLSVSLLSATLPLVDPAEAEDVQALFGTHSLPAMPLFLLSSGGLAIVVLMACLLFASARPSFVSEALQAVGRMAFTWYIFHILAILGLAFILDESRPLPVPQASMLWAGLCVLMVLLSLLWRRWMGRGPLERVLRWVEPRAPKEIKVSP